MVAGVVCLALAVALGPVSGSSSPAASRLSENAAAIKNPGRYEPVRSARYPTSRGPKKLPRLPPHCMTDMIATPDFIEVSGSSIGIENRLGVCRLLNTPNRVTLA